MAHRRPDRRLGPGHDEFWAWCNQEQLRLQKCGRCRRLSWPVVSACEYCGGTQLAWDRLSGRGTLVSWCSFEHDYYGGLLPLPWDTLLVELEEGPLFISNPRHFTNKDIAPGMPVKVAFLACEDSAGEFNLPVFERA